MATIDTHTFVTNFNADAQSSSDIKLMTDERGHMYPISHLFDGVTLGESFQVVAPSDQPGRLVKIKPGYIQVPFDDYAYLGWLDEEVTLTIGQNTEANPRYSAIVAYINQNKQYTESQTNNPGVLCITEVEGTASATPAEVGEQAIRAVTEIGENPFVVLAQVYLQPNISSITPNNIIDKRTSITLREGIQLPYGSYATGMQQATGSSFSNPIQLAVINANDPVPTSSTDTDLLVCRISQ